MELAIKKMDTASVKKAGMEANVAKVRQIANIYFFRFDVLFKRMIKNWG